MRVGGLPRRHLLGSGPELSEQVAFIVYPDDFKAADNQAHYWRSLTYDRYTEDREAIARSLARKDNPPMPAVLPVWGDAATLAGWLARQRNDMQAAAIAAAPVVGQVIAAIAATDGCLLARMSGSGATIRFSRA